MDNRPILFIDSGIGGLLYCRDFIKHNPQEEVCYLADIKNFPYGQRGKEELTSILISLIEKLLKTIDPKIIVIACNTATISSLEPLRNHFSGISFVGTVPAIKPAANASKNRKVGVLGTTRTVEDPYNQNLAKDYCEIYAVAAPELAEFVEQRFEKADEKEKNDIVKKYIDIFRKEGVDTLVLGCTHYLYLLEEFRNEASPDIQIFDSLDGITKRVEFLLNENDDKLRSDIDFEPVHWLFLTGSEPQGSAWQERCQELGFALCMLDSL
ncbi:MAG: glutamate racemase [Treponema sp.]|nr:glutamate racemase [Treponema sp.]